MIAANDVVVGVWLLLAVLMVVVLVLRDVLADLIEGKIRIRHALRKSIRPLALTSVSLSATILAIGLI